MRVAGLIGDPVAHSLSPVMHNAAFEKLGLDARYELWETPLDALPARVDSLRDPGVIGANVTVPHKQAIMPLLDEVTERASRIGAVNTIVPDGDRLRGDNTDAYGFAKALETVIEPAAVRSVIVVGAGGAARAVLVSLQELGIAQLVVVNRTLERGQMLARELSRDDSPPVIAAAMQALSLIAPQCHVVVNATSMGWHENELPFDSDVVATLPDDAVVVDLTYRETYLLRLARSRGILALDGLPMLVHQGARAFELWTGREAPVEAMTQAVLAEQARRA